MARLRTFAEHETIAQREARRMKQGELRAILKKLVELAKRYQPVLSEDDEALLADMERKIHEMGGMVLRNLET